MNTVLVTGGLGYIGSHTVVELVNKDYQVVIVDYISDNNPETLKVLEKIYDLVESKKQLIAFHNLNICNNDNVDYLFRKYNFTSVIHFAAYKSVPESICNPLKYYTNNVTGLITLLIKCQQYNVNNFIFSSSATVYGESESPLYETSKIGIGITNPYGQTKYICECILKDVCKSNKDFNCIVLRYFNPVGSHPSGKLRLNYTESDTNLMSHILKIADLHNKNTNNVLPIPKKQSLKIYGNTYDTPDGTCIRDFIHVVDLAEAHIASLNKLQGLMDPNISNIDNDIENYRCYNIGTGNPCTVLTLINTFMKTNDIAFPIEFRENREGDIPVVYCNADKAKQELGWVATKTVQNMCRDAYYYID